MSHKYVSNKQTLQNQSFLSKLSSTLGGRINPDPLAQEITQSSIEWRSTKTVSKRIKTATGTIAVYEDMSEEEVARLQTEAIEAAGGVAPPTARPLDARAGKIPAPPPPPPPPPKPPQQQQQQQQQQYVVVKEHVNSEGAKVRVGQRMIFVATSAGGDSNKRIKLDDDTELHLLDNSAARHKMAVRPRKTRPDSRTQLATSASASDVTEEQQQQQEEWLMQTLDGSESIWLPKHVMEVDTSAPPLPPPPPPAPKRSAEEGEEEEEGLVPLPVGDALRQQMLQEIRNFKPKKRKSSAKLVPTPEDEARAKRKATVRELIETEEELVKDLHFAMEQYYCLMDQSSTPRHVKDHKEVIFSNFSFFPDFHKNVLIEGIKYHAETPRMIGKTFLRLERDFDQHAEYCSSEPLAQEFLENNAPVREYFEEHSQKIGDDKRIQEHLQLPIQRLNDYQLLLRELVKYGTVLGDDTEELQKALELMQTVPQRATDAKFIASIEGFRGNLYRLGRLLRHDWFSVLEAGRHRPHDRYLFLFKARVLVTKVKRIGGDRSIFLLKNVIRLPETTLGSLSHPKKLEFIHIEADSHPNYPIVVEARSAETRDAWLEGVQEHVVESASVDDLLFDDEIRIVSEEGEEIDEGRAAASPVPGDFEDFAAEEEFFEDLPEDTKEAKQGRIIPILLEDDGKVPELEDQQKEHLKKSRAKGEESSSPLPARKKAKADILQLEELQVLQQEQQQEQVIQSKQTSHFTEEQTSTFYSSSTTRTSAGTNGYVESSATFESSTTAKAAAGTTSTTAATVVLEELREATDKQVEIATSVLRQAEPQRDSGVTEICASSSAEVAESKEADEKSSVQRDKDLQERRLTEEAEEAAKRAKMVEITTPGTGPKPVFTKTIVGAVVEPGEAATFVCQVAHPTPYFVTWLKDNKPMDDKLADRIQQVDDRGTHQLKILNCRPEDTGIYTAKATDTEQATATCSAQLLVHELTEEERAARIADKKPFFYVKLRNTTVIENTNLSYVVHVKGDPMPEVKFLKDGKPLKEDERVKFKRDAKQGHYELLISHVQLADAGTYRCTAMNVVGEAECQGVMDVVDMLDLHVPGAGFGEHLVRLDASHMPPHFKTFVVATKEQEALQSLQGKGSLLAKGETADFKWFRDGTEFDPLERFNVHYKDEEDTLALVFQNVTPEDAGLYTCVASTSCGRISCSAELTVEGAVKRLAKEPIAPAIADPLSDVAVSAGGSAFLECKITGYPLPDLSWTRNGLDVKVGGRIKQMWEDDDSVSLIIKNVKDSDAGQYRVVAKNELGEVDTECKLAIRAGPKIKRVQKEVACTVGSALNYSVEVEGEPLPEVKWLKDGKELLDSDRIKLVKESDTVFAFKISSMTLEDCGTYTVMASNDIGQRSEQFEVMCDSAPLITRGIDPETEKKLSNDHTFEVRASGSPKPVARWFKDDKEIMADDKFRMVKDDAFYMLKIRKLDRKDKGIYKIVLSNSSGEAESEGALVIRAPPEFLSPLKDACAKEGTKDVKLFVEFQGNPKPSIKWTFKDRPIREETEGFTIKNTDTTSMLIISEALADFVGNFTITLGNEYGDSVGKARFRLHEPPAIVEGLGEETEFLEATEAKIVIKATGVPVPEIKWTLDGKKYSPDDRRCKLKKEGEEVYIIWTNDAKTEDTGLYQAILSNCEGTASTEGHVTINTPPHILKSNFVEGKKVVAMHKFVLEVEATAVPEAVATWLFNDHEVKEAEDVKISFDGKKYVLERIGCDPEHSGQYTCKLQNKIKEAAETGQVTVYEKEARVRNALKDMFVKEFTTATLKCQIVGDPVPSVEWLRDGKPIAPSGKVEITEDRSTHWHSLVFRDVAEKDRSVFTVKGKNTHGECETKCNLGVLVRPQPGELNSDTVDYGKNVKLGVYIHAFPPPTMVWYQNGNQLSDCPHTEYQRDEEAEVYSLYLTSAVLEDIGTYSFNASNEAGDATGECKLHVHSVVPSVNLELKSQDICLEDEVTFTLRCCGLPLPVPQWTKKGVVQQNDDRTLIETVSADTHTITFRDVRLEDYGKIEVVATSVVGSTSSSCELTQKTLECEVLEGLENLTKGAEGEDVTLTVLVRASPRPVVVWTKDSDVMVESDKVIFTAEKVTYCDLRLSLTLVEATSLESGQYRLKFSNQVNEASTETALVVRPERKAPRIKGKPEDAEVTEKSPAIFKCKIAGFPRPDVKWMKEGRQVRPTDVINSGMAADGSFFLEFRHCTAEDAGPYTLVAENEEGRTEVTVNLTVNPPASRPEFLQGLRPTKVIRGYPCRMEVRCGGFPRPTVAWLKDGQPLEVDGKHVKQLELDDGTVVLQIEEASDADAGRYSCVARNADGDNTSSAPLAVLGHAREDGQLDGPPRITSGLKDMTADEGKTLILPVAVRGGPVPDMKWFKDGKEIKLDDRMFFTYDGDRSFLEIRPCRGGDSGVYRCEVTAADGSGTASTECTVTIRKCFEAPSFSQGFNSLQQLPGLDIRLTVRADGVPRPELAWFKDNKPLDMSDDRYKFRKDGQATTLLVRGCTYSDSGIYRVVATNKEGVAEHEAAVEVADEIDPNRRAEAPVFLKVIGDQEVFENDHARFKAVVSGKPIPDFQWLKNGHPIIETNRIIPERDADGIIRLTLRHVVEEDSGVYQLKVFNDYGRASCMGKLVCECISKKVRRPVGDEYQGWDKVKRSGIPIPLPDKPFISALSDRRVTISWNPYIAQGPQPPVTYQVEMCECPEGEWFTARTGIRGISVDITNLAPKCDYKFRVRNENKYGVSEPSPYVQTFRNKLEVPPVSYEPKLSSNYVYSGDGPYVPEGFNIDRDYHGNYFAAPRFLRLLHDTQYGQRGFNASIKWYVFGFPTPKVRFTFNGQPLETCVKGGRITHTQEASGEVMIFIEKITEKDIGLYECHARNEHGESKQRIKFEIAEYPRVTQHLEETHIRSHATGRIMCRIAGYPPCNVQWYKDWVPMKTSFRIRSQFIEPDMYILNFNGAVVRDSGIYSLSAVNVAGVATSSCLFQVEEDESFAWTGPGKGRVVPANRRRGALEDHYDVGDELGRGTQGIVYHCVEHFTGRNFAAKSMWGRDMFKVWMLLEHEMMNLSNSSRYISRLYDCYESAKNMVLVTELCAGGELLHSLTQHQYTTEYEVAHYIRQILEGIEYMHDRCIAHLGLNIGDVLLTRPNGTDIKLVDLSLARTIRMTKLQPLDYGMPEFVAPEVALGRGVSYPADLWAVGVITYLLLSGTSPFRGENDRETLTKVQKGELTFDVEAFANITPEAKDFIAKLLQFKPENRLDVKASLRHPWLLKSQLQPRDPHKINTDSLRTYAAKFREWYANASCRRWYRRRPLQSAFTHPSKMVYPPGEVYTPPDSPDRELLEAPVDVGDYMVPHKDLSYELEPISSDSRYQQGPDTYLLQLRDVDFPVRLRQYMKVAANRSPGYAAQVRENLYDYTSATPQSDEKKFMEALKVDPPIQTVYSLRTKYDTSTYDYCCSAGEINLDRYIRIPVVHERRRFTDIMDEEIDDERRRTLVDKYSAGFYLQNAATCSLDLPRRVTNEVRSRPQSSLAPPALADAPEGETAASLAPFLREKPATVAIGAGRTVELTVLATGSPAPIVQWFRNDIILAEGSRHVILTEKLDVKSTRSTLTFTESRKGDVGSYKVVARNLHGQTLHRFRLVQACLPSICDCPEVGGVSDTAVLLQWRPPPEDGGAHVLAYNLQIKAEGDIEWRTVDDGVDMERYVVTALQPDSLYQFRIAARNALGWGDFSIGTPAIRSGPAGCPKLRVPPGLSVEDTRSGRAARTHPHGGEAAIDYSKETEPVVIKTGEGADLQVRKYQLVDELHRGRFSTVGRCVRADDHRLFAVKILPMGNREEQVRLELDLLRSLRHTRLAALHESYQLEGGVSVLVQELLSGVDIVKYLSMRHEYSEQLIVVLLTQVLDGLSYLQWRGISHLDLQPDNLVLTSTRFPSLKIVDFGSARKVTQAGTSVPVNGLTDYIAPEVLFDGKAYPNTDIWSLGVLAYVLLSGVTPFRGDTEDDRKANIQCVRYRFEWLPTTTTQEATRFLMLIFKRDPSKRPSVTECLEHRWMNETDFMVRKRERATIISNRIREYSQQYHGQQTQQASNNPLLLSFGGLKQ